MIRSLLLFLLITLSIFLFGQKNNNVPGIAEVVKKFYSDYSTDELEYPHVFFEKRPEGWCVVTKKIVNNSLEDEQRFLFYSYRDKKYHNLNFPKGSKQIENISEVVDPYDVQWFQLYPYYGYNGWYKDVIKDLEGRSEQSDNDLYILGRAYSNQANGLLSDQFGFSTPEDVFKVPLTLNCLSTDQIKNYENISGKATALFKQVKDRNPSFQTIVGNISIKYANEVMVPFHNLTVYASKYAEGIKLPEKLYPDSILKKAKEWMNACSENAIFLSFGDNDFYPLLYLQHHDNFRRDIHVVNYSLLGLARYIYAYTQPLFDSRGINISCDTSTYGEGKNDYFLVNKSEKVIGFDSIIMILRNKNKDEILTAPSNIFSIKYSSGKANKGVTIGMLANVEVEGAYLIKNQWILLDLINHLNGRQLVLPSQFFDELKSLNNFLRCNGIVCKYQNE